MEIPIKHILYSLTDIFLIVTHFKLVKTGYKSKQVQIKQLNYIPTIGGYQQFFLIFNLK